MTIFPLQGFALPIIQSPLGLPHVLTVATALFALGLFAALAHRSLLRILMGFQLMILASLISLVAFTAYLHPEGLQGHAVALTLAALALAQLGVGLALIAQLLPRGGAPEPTTPENDPLNVDRYDDLKW